MKQRTTLKNRTYKIPDFLLILNQKNYTTSSCSYLLVYNPACFVINNIA